MTAQIFWNSGIQFFNSCSVYYVVQIVRCVLLSFVVLAFVFTLRKTVLKNRVFLKGALWSLFIPVLFIGKMKFFYENRIGIKFFSWLTEMCMSHTWICWLYLCGVFLYAALLFYRRRKDVWRIQQVSPGSGRTVNRGVGCTNDKKGTRQRVAIACPAPLYMSVWGEEVHYGRAFILYYWKLNVTASQEQPVLLPTFSVHVKREPIFGQTLLSNTLHGEVSLNIGCG